MMAEVDSFRQMRTYDTNSSASESNVESKESCSTGDLLGPFGLLVQGLLAFLAFTCLIERQIYNYTSILTGKTSVDFISMSMKRYCEPKHSRRPWKIWFYDTSKQALGAAVIHFANVFLADSFQGDPCTWYIISFLLDSTVGLLVIYIGLKTTQILAHRYSWKSLFFGEYGEPPKCSAWLGQTVLYIVVMIVEKLLMTLLVLFDFWKKVRHIIMSPITNPLLELAIVMFLVPLVVNAILFWVVDNFLKRSIRQSKTIYVSSEESRVKYFRSSDNVKCYNRIEKGEESDALSAEEEFEVRRRSNDPSESQLLEASC